jgi:excisionase family DNA binding protein
MTLNQDNPTHLTRKPEEAPAFLTIDNPTRLTRKPEEAAPMLGVGRNGVYDLIRSGQLRSIRVGRKILIPLAAIEDFLNGGAK